MDRVPAGPSAPELRGPRILLRAPTDSDVRDRAAWGRAPEVVRAFGGDEGYGRWIDRLWTVPIGWAIETEKRCVGGATLRVQDPAARWASYTIGIFDESTWNRGLGTETTRLVLRHAFDDLLLHRVALRVLSFNRRAIHVYEKCGFVREGVERECAVVDGQWQDDVIMGILDREYHEASRNWSTLQTGGAAVDTSSDG